MEPRITIYTTVGCPYCTKALTVLRREKVRHTEISVANRPELRDEIERLCGRRDVPQVFVDGEHIGDDDAVQEWADAGKWKAFQA